MKEVGEKEPRERDGPVTLRGVIEAQVPEPEGAWDCCDGVDRWRCKRHGRGRKGYSEEPQGKCDKCEGVRVCWGAPCGGDQADGSFFRLGKGKEERKKKQRRQE